MNNGVKAAVLAAVILAAGVGCFILMQGPDPPSQPDPDTPPSATPLKSNMFDGYWGDLSGAVSLGITDSKPNSDSTTGSALSSAYDPLTSSFTILGQESSDDKNFLVKIDSKGNIEEVRFIKGEEELEQDNIDAYVYKMYVYENFIYMSFTDLPNNIPENVDYMMNGTFHKSYYKCDLHYQSFVINSKTGKVYSLSEFSEIRSIAGDHIVANEKLYKMSVGEDDELVFTSVISNENIHVYYADMDIYGKLFVANTMLTNETESTVFYYPYGGETNYLFSEKGRMFVFGKGSLIGQELRHYGPDGTIVSPSKDCMDVIWPFGIVIQNGFEIFLEGISRPDYYGMGSGFYHAGGGIHVSVIDDPGTEMFVPFSGAMYIDGTVLAVIYGASGTSQLIQYRINEMTLDDLLRGEIPNTPIKVFNTQRFNMEYDTLIAEIQEIGSTQKWRISYNGGSVTVEEYAPIIYLPRIITIQPLN